MTNLSKLNLSDKTKAAMLTSPEAKLRGKMLGALGLQIDAAKAMLNGETFIRRAMRWWDDPETGERVRKEVLVHPTGDPIQSACGAACGRSGRTARTPRDQFSVLLVVWVSGSLSMRARNFSIRPSTRPPESLIAEAYSERSVSAMEMP